MTDPLIDDYRRTSLEISEIIAPGWERWRSNLEEAMAPVRDWMVRELAPKPDTTVLELAAGAGDTGFQAITAAGPDSRLISTDLSPAMVDVARRRRKELGLANVELRVLDAECLDLETDSVDGVLCRFGYMVMGDPAAALSETRRVLRPNGRLALAVWDAPERNPFFTTIAAPLLQVGHLSPPNERLPSPFSMANPRHLKIQLEAAGFTTESVATVPVEFHFADISEYLGFMADTAGPVALALRQLDDDERKPILTSLDTTLAGFATDDGYRVPGSAHLVLAI